MNAETQLAEQQSGATSSRRRHWACWIALILVVAAVVAAANPLRVRYHLRQGRSELADGAPEAASRHFRAAEEIDGDSAEVHFWLARTSRKQGDVDALRAHLDRALELGYRNPERLRREWLLLLAETGRIRESEPYLSEMLADPKEDVVEICEAFVKGYCVNLNFDKALALLEAWQRDYPRDYRPRLWRCQIYNGNEEWTKAAAAGREALRLAAEEAAVRQELARALRGSGDLEQSERQYRAALRTDSDDIETLLGLATVLREQKRYVQAAQFTRRVLELAPDHFPATLLLAQLLLELERPDEAARLLTPFVERWPEDLQARYLLAQALCRAGQTDQADEHFAVYADLERRASPRLEELKRAVHERPGDQELRFELGRLVLRHVSRSEGVAWLQSVFQFGPDHAGAHQALAAYYEKIGRRKLAERHRRLAARRIEPPAEPSALSGDPP